MERFFLEHHVMRDRDPDELRRVASDSEASEEEEEITERVRSVHDPTGPWKQREVDGAWGQPQTKKAGTANRNYRSQHTGPKGVIKDYKDHKRYQRQERERNENERQAALLRIAKGSIGNSDIGTTNQPPLCSAHVCECDAEDGEDDGDDMLLNDEFLQKYNAMRVYQMSETAKKRATFGKLDVISPKQYVELTDSIPADVTMFVHLYDPESYPCGLMNEHLERIAQELARIKFVALVAKDADESIAMRDLPVVLVYRGQQLQETIVTVSEELDGEFTYDRIKLFVLSHAG